MRRVFRVYYTNMGYYAQEVFNSVSAALEYGKSKGFQRSVTGYPDNSTYATWCPIRGVDDDF